MAGHPKPGISTCESYFSARFCTIDSMSKIRCMCVLARFSWDTMYMISWSLGACEGVDEAGFLALWVLLAIWAFWAF